jgi:hypothetical protein
VDVLGRRVAPRGVACLTTYDAGYFYKLSGPIGSRCRAAEVPLNWRYAAKINKLPSVV